jgi:hypothetical protein
MAMETDDPEENHRFREPWYRKLNDPLPFRLQTMFEASRSKGHSRRDINSVSSFQIYIRM